MMYEKLYDYGYVLERDRERQREKERDRERERPGWTYISGPGHFLIQNHIV